MSNILNVHIKKNNHCIFKLKRKVSTYIILELLNHNLNIFENQLNEKLNNSPQFFKFLPCIIDISNIDYKQIIDFKNIKKIIRRQGLILIGVQGANEYQKYIAVNENLSVINKYLPEKKIKKHIINKTKIINRNIRSGEQIYEKETNLIILKPISSGAEVLSDGHIHIYSTLKGKALAGINGNLKARIFCKKIEAELVAISGKFKLTEEINEDIWSKPVMVFVENNKLKIKPF